MMTDLATQLSQGCAAAFAQIGLDTRWSTVKPSARPELADFQCNGCMGAARQAGMNPRVLAEQIATQTSWPGIVERIDVAGPGFVNIVVRDDALAARVDHIRHDARAGGACVSEPEKIIVDFGGPNIAKPMHVGHLRSAVIGDTFVRLLRFMGDEVIGDIHLGDWGLQMGLLIVAMMDEQPGLAWFDSTHTGPFPTEPPVTMADLSRLYPQASKRAQNDPVYAERARAAVAQMQAGRPGYRALLAHFIAVSTAAFRRDYAFLDVSFDLWKGESDVSHLMEPLVASLKTSGLARLDDGAWVIDVTRDDDKKPVPPLMLVNSRGGAGYQAMDLATIRDRMDTIAPDRIVYVVDQRQAFHFEQVFRAADKIGLIREDRLIHLGFGTVNGPDGKPFRTRTGGTLHLADLNAMAQTEALKKINEARLSITDDGQRKQIADLVARAALRFADLCNQRTTDYVFDLERFTRFEGKTGPYLLYAAVRIKAILRRADKQDITPGPITITCREERQLALILDRFADALHSARDKWMTHYICEHVHALAQAFSAFYTLCPILKGDIATPVQRSRLALATATLRQLEAGLGILGITVPDRM